MATTSIPPVPYKTKMTEKGGLVSLQWGAWFRQLLANVQASSIVNPMIALGDMIFGGNQGAVTRLPGNTTSTKQFLTQTGLGGSSSQPVWGVLVSSDIPNNIANTTGSAGSLTQSLTQFQLVMGEGTSAGIGSLGSIGTLGQILISGGPGIAPSWGDVLSVYGTRSAPILITAAGGITPNTNQRQLIRIAGSGGAVTISASPAIAAGNIDGQELILEGSSTSNSVTINDGTGIEQSESSSMSLSVGDKIAYIWNAGASVWTEQYRFFSGIAAKILTDDSGNPLTDDSGNPLTP